MIEEELRRALADGEGQRTEFKATFAEQKEALESLGAFTNAEGGTVFFGIRLNGDICGVTLGANTLETFANLVKDNSEPRMHPAVEHLTISSSIVVAATVPSLSQDVQYVFNRPLIRVGRTNQLMSALEQKRRLGRSVLPPVESPVEQLKRYIADPTHRIALHDLVISEVIRVRKLLDTAAFSAQSPTPDPVELLKRMNAVEEASEELCALAATGCYWGDTDRIPLWREVLQRLTAGFAAPQGYTMWLDLKLYPALLVFYAGGVAALAAGKATTVHALCAESVKHPRYFEHPEPAAYQLHPSGVINIDIARQLPGLDRRHTPVNDWISEWLKPILAPFVHDDAQFETLFDQFEFLLALLSFDTSGYAGIGRFGWKHEYWLRDRNYQQLASTLLPDTLRSQVLAAGMFRGDRARLDQALNAATEVVKGAHWV